MKTICCHTKQFVELENNAICMNSSCNNYLGQSKIIKTSNTWLNLTAYSLFTFYCLFSFDDFSMSGKSQEFLPIKIQESINEPLTKENLEKELIRNEVICIHEVMAQIKLESGNLNSFLLKRTNNMLGMRFPFGRATKAIGLYLPAKDTIIYGNKSELKAYKNVNQYAVFANWQDAVTDYKLWQTANFKIAEKYLAFLGNVYAEDSAYVKKIKQVASKAY